MVQLLQWHEKLTIQRLPIPLLIGMQVSYFKTEKRFNIFYQFNPIITNACTFYFLFVFVNSGKTSENEGLTKPHVKTNWYASKLYWNH